MRTIGVACLLLAALSAPALGRGLDKIEPQPKGWQGQVFEPRFDYPAKVARQSLPWMETSFRKEPERYLRQVLAYALEGQDRRHWRLQANAVRSWYHVPWLGPGANGREFIHGLTRGRDLQPGELGTACRQTWALAFYNDIGGLTMGRIWQRTAKGVDPDLTALPFPVGTVAVKLAFTDADVADDPRMADAPEIDANIHADATPDDGRCADAIDARGRPAARAPRALRLVQVDLAVREERASYKTGWVFGSFTYDGTRPGNDPWAKLVPMGLMWGNDPALSDTDAAGGATPRQSIVFPAGQGFGRGGRMNGLVDERGSACSSCHMAAQWPTIAPMSAPAGWEHARCWFRNLDARYPFGFAPETRSGCSDPAALKLVRPLDFSLQLGIALRNWSLDKTATKDARTRIGKLTRRGDKLHVDGLESLPLKR